MDNEETPIVDKKKHWTAPLQIPISAFSVFLASSAFFVILPTLYPRLVQLDVSSTTYGWIVAGYSIGQMFGSPTLSWLADRTNTKKALLVSLVLETVANVLYSVTDYLWVIMCSRILLGLSAGNIAVVRNYVSILTTAENRTKAMATISFAQSLGYTLGPLLGSLFSLVSIPPLVTPETSPGYGSAILSFLNLLVVIFFFNIEKTSHPHIPITNPTHSINDPTKKSMSLLTKIQILSLFMAFFMVAYIFSLFETVVVYLGTFYYGWSEGTLGIFMGVIGGLILVTNLVLRSDWFRAILTNCFVLESHKQKMVPTLFDKRLILLSFFIMTAGAVLGVRYAPHHPPLWQFAMSFGVLLGIGLPSGQVAIISSFTQMVPPTKRALLLGLLIAGASGARIVGPVSSMYLVGGSDLNLFVVIIGILVLGMIVMFGLFGVVP